MTNAMTVLALTDEERRAIGIDDAKLAERRALQTLQTPSDAWFNEHFFENELEIAELAVKLYVSNIKSGKL